MEIFVLIVIMSVLAVILFFALKKLIDSLSTDSKDYYFKKVQDYDEKIAQKEQELQNLENQLNKEENVKNIERVVERSDVDKDLLNLLSSTDYATINALKVASKVDEIFQIDEEKIIEEFLHKARVNEKYKIYQKLQDRFSPNLIYKLKMLNAQGQVNAISKMLTPEEKEVFDAYVETRKFKLEKFLLDLDEVIENNLPNIEVIVGSKNKNYNYLSPYIKTTYSEEIYKGMIIKYQDRIYDYSINERDV